MRSTVRNYLILTLGLILSPITQAAAEGIVAGLSIDKGLSIQQAQSAGYTCRDSEDFLGMSRCDKTITVSSSAQTYTTMMIDKSGRSVYLMENNDGVSSSSSQVKSDIDRLSGVLGRRPSSQKIQKLPNGKRTALFVTWGDVRLEELGFESSNELAAGTKIRRGLLVDCVGFVNLSAKNDWPVYRIVGGRGVIYVASSDANGRGHRHILEVDTAEVMKSLYAKRMSEILVDDAKLAPTDFSLWDRVAVVTRELARDTRPQIAVEMQRAVFRDRPSRKLFSEVWPYLPGGTIQSLMEHTYRRTIDHYMSDTQFPQIRADLQRIVKDFPRDPFLSFAYYTLGDLEAAQASFPNSPVRDVVEYALGYREIVEILKVVQKNIVREGGATGQFSFLAQTGGDDFTPPIGEINAYLNENDRKRIFLKWPDLLQRATAAELHLKAVLAQPKVPHADDAAYFLGWIAYHSGDDVHALEYFANSMSIGNGDYAFGGGEKQASRLLQIYTPQEQVAILEKNKEFTGSTRLWYVAARTAYRDHDYKTAHEIARKGLLRLEIDPDKLPVTTDADRIDEALRAYPEEKRISYNLGELIYVYFSSNEINSYLKYYNKVAIAPAERFNTDTLTIIKKYSKILDESEENQNSPAKTEWHKDVKQALFLVETALAKTRGKPEFAKFREWLHYRRIRVIAAVRPDEIDRYIGEFEQEAPYSDLLDDAEAERIFVLAYRTKSPEKAFVRLAEMKSKFHGGNALDNAYSWAARGYYCAGNIAEGRKIDIEITKRFPLTRHALYALRRLSQGNNVDISCGP